LHLELARLTGNIFFPLSYSISKNLIINTLELLCNNEKQMDGETHDFLLRYLLIYSLYLLIYL
jgi:hypothetical protein